MEVNRLHDVSDVQTKTVLDLYRGSFIPSRKFDKKDVKLILDNAESIMREVFMLQPLFIPYLDISVDDPMISPDILRYSRMFKRLGVSDQDQNATLNAGLYVKFGMTMLALCSNIDVAYDMLKFEPRGVIESILDPTMHVLNHPQRPLAFDMQQAYLTSLVYHVAQARYPTHPDKGVVEVMSMLKMENDEDYSRILRKSLSAVADVRIHYH